MNEKVLAGTLSVRKKADDELQYYQVKGKIRQHDEDKTEVIIETIAHAERPSSKIGDTKKLKNTEWQSLAEGIRGQVKDPTKIRSATAKEVVSAGLLASTASRKEIAEEWVRGLPERDTKFTKKEEGEKSIRRMFPDDGTPQTPRTRAGKTGLGRLMGEIVGSENADIEWSKGAVEPTTDNTSHPEHFKSQNATFSARTEVVKETISASGKSKNTGATSILPSANNAADESRPNEPIRPRVGTEELKKSNPRYMTPTISSKAKVRQKFNHGASTEVNSGRPRWKI
ncbi:hypothetical protein [Marinomonas sp. THO17]|uniref:hypothetical protein n=1 Tax=Marinomonas sp. THO17 TaxID=3149048 RepID=UPI00336BDDFE